MSFPARWSTAPGGSGDFTSAPVAGTTTAGTALSTSNVQPGTLSCLFTVLADTNTLTITGKFQVSADNSTWYNIAGDAQNPANVAIATGTGGADTAVSVVLPVPAGALGWKWIRPAVVNGVATGASIDTYSMTWYFRTMSGF